MAIIDLHMHTNHSDDGEFAVFQIIDMLEKQGIKYAAITDHNSVKGVAEAINLSRHKCVKVISGVELDCSFCDMNFHLLGYGFDYSRKEFYDIEQDIVNQETKSASEKIYKFKKATGIDIKENEVFDKAGSSVITGELIAEVVLNKEDAYQYEILRAYLPGGHKSDMPYVNFFWDFFSQGKVAYVPISYLSLQDAIELIHDACGIAVLAHPGQNLKNDFAFIDKIIQQKIDGIEVFSSYHSMEDSQYFLAKAQSNGLIATCGSDFHGKNKPNITLGSCKTSIDENIIIESIFKS